MTIVLSVTGDHHFGGTTALCPMGVKLADGGRYRLNPIQKWLMECYSDYWKRVEYTMEQYKAPLWVVFNGDTVEGNHHETDQIISPSARVMRNAAIKGLKKPLKRLSPQEVFVTVGTSAHVGQGGLWDHIIAERLSANRDIETDNPAWNALEIIIENTHCLFAHHGRAGTRSWTKGTGARTVAAELTNRFNCDYGILPPKLAVFGHVHRFEDSGHNYPVHVQTHGCWQLSTGYGYKISPWKPPDIGGLIYVIDDDKIINHDPIVRYVPRRSEPWQRTK